MNKRKESIQYKVYSPGGNTTAIVPAGNNRNLADSAREIMQADARIEQVGFLQKSVLPGCDFHLQMMGNEFCGNAARCAAMYISRLKDKTQMRLTVSGFVLPVTAKISSGVVTLYLPGEFLQTISKVREGWLVDFQGIRFLVSFKKINQQLLGKLIRKYAGNFEAVGVVVVSKITAGYKISPWVWVKATKTLITETACASGSLAVAAVLCQQNPSKKSYKIKQPSSSQYNLQIIRKLASIEGFVLSGKVEVLA